MKVKDLVKLLSSVNQEADVCACWRDSDFHNVENDLGYVGDNLENAEIIGINIEV